MFEKKKVSVNSYAELFRDIFANISIFPLKSLVVGFTELFFFLTAKHFTLQARAASNLIIDFVFGHCSSSFCFCFRFFMVFFYVFFVVIFPSETPRPASNICPEGQERTAYSKIPFRSGVQEFRTRQSHLYLVIFVLKFERGQLIQKFLFDLAFENFGREKSHLYSHRIRFDSVLRMTIPRFHPKLTGKNNCPRCCDNRNQSLSCSSIYKSLFPHLFENFA